MLKTNTIDSRYFMYIPVPRVLIDGMGFAKSSSLAK